MSTERPVLLRSGEVRLVLDDRMTTLRRPVKPRYPWEVQERDNGAPWPWYPDYVTGGEWDGWVPCPYGQPGDRLWGRETWGMSYTDIAGQRPLVEGGTWGSPDRPGRPQCVVFRADDSEMPSDEPFETARWCPSVHMPRWACRLVLEVAAVRLDRAPAPAASWEWVVDFRKATP